jgi:hypothetical protein
MEEFAEAPGGALVVAGGEDNGREGAERAKQLLVDRERINEDDGPIAINHGVGVAA